MLLACPLNDERFLRGQAPGDGGIPNDASTLDLGLSIGDFAGGAGGFRRKHMLLKRQHARGSEPDVCLDLTGWGLCVPGWPAVEVWLNCALASLLAPPGFARVCGW